MGAFLGLKYSMLFMVTSFFSFKLSFLEDVRNGKSKNPKDKSLWSFKIFDVLSEIEVE